MHVSYYGGLFGIAIETNHHKVLFTSNAFNKLHMHVLHVGGATKFDNRMKDHHYTTYRINGLAIQKKCLNGLSHEQV